MFFYKKIDKIWPSLMRANLGISFNYKYLMDLTSLEDECILYMLLG